MSFVHVVVARSNPEATIGAATVLLKSFEKDWIAAGYPSNADVWGRPGSDDFSHHYLFSGEAARCAPKLMQSHGATPCPRGTDPARDGFKKLVI